MREVENQFRAVCAFIRGHLDQPDALRLPALAAQAGLSPFHFQRRFKAAMGVTPRQYVEALRMESLKEDLRTQKSVTEAIYSAGFACSSRVYEGVGGKLGMTPKQYRAGGERIEISYATAETPLGLVMFGATDRGLCFLEFGPSHSELLQMLREEFPAAQLLPMKKPHTAEFDGWVAALSQFLQRDMPVHLHGTAFQQKVWRFLQTIPAGRTETYTGVAKAIGHPKAVRAVASACAANCIALVVPCHRVIRGDGGLGGYRWGLDRKQALLDMERARRF